MESSRVVKQLLLEGQANHNRDGLDIPVCGWISNLAYRSPGLWAVPCDKGGEISCKPQQFAGPRSQSRTINKGCHCTRITELKGRRQRVEKAHKNEIEERRRRKKLGGLN